MRRHYFSIAALCLVSCGEPPAKVPPFISITLLDPEGFTSQQADTFEVTNRAIVEGNPIEKVFTIEAPEHLLPTSFSIAFSEPIRGINVDVDVRGLAGGQEVFFASDDGLGNSDTTPDACREDCKAPSCGDGIVDALFGEECDDGNGIDADGCEADCTLPACGNGIFERWNT